MRHGVFVPPFDELADPRALMDLARLAEDRGFDGFFVWDHVNRPDPPRPVADPWVALAAVASVTERLLLGPMVTPIVRRRPQKLARESVTLDHLSRGRVVLGMGLGVDSGRELSAFGEVVGAAERAAMLEEGLELLEALWSGERVDHHGRYFTADGVTFLPRPYRRSAVPVWLAARTAAPAPLRRAARYQGLFPIEVSPPEVAAMLEVVAAARGGLDGFEVATLGDPADLGAFAAAGITWWMTSFAPGDPVDRVAAVIGAGPPA